MHPYEPWSAERAGGIIDGLKGLEGATLPILHALQDTFGHVPDEAIPLIAEALDLSRAEIFGCVSFYHDFRRAPAGRHVVKLCRAEACQAAGGEGVAKAVEERFSSDPQVTVEAVYCLGLCACAPAALVDGQPLGRIDAAAVAAAVAGEA